MGGFYVTTGLYNCRALLLASRYGYLQTCAVMGGFDGLSSDCIVVLGYK